MRNVVNLLCNRWVSGVICLFIILLVYSSKHGYGIFGSFAMLTKCVQILCGLFVVWGLFVKHLSLSRDTVCGRFLELVGRRSLDVYFLHYFLLPVNMTFVGDFFAGFDIPFVEYCLAVVVALLLTVASLGLGQILRLSPLVARWLLGVK